MMELLAKKSLDYVLAFAGALVLTLVLTPIVRELNRRLGMVDKPDPRRINKVPIPRGGGLALIMGVIVSYTLFVLASGRPPLQGDELSDATYWKLVAISLGIGALGYADDKFSLRPSRKLLGQVLFAALAWGWAGLGFHRLWPEVPWWVDLPMTVFWIVGAVNAFNLIDGLDGLASGLALIATVGMAGSLFLIENPQAALFHFAFAGGLVGFLRYNYNPASVFLGDCGSMYIGFTIAVMPLMSQTPNSFLVSVGVPLLAMGVPIFDTFLAILRRSIRHLIRKRNASEEGNDKVMTADADHLHHRILRAVGLNQRKATLVLYSLAAGAVAVGLFGMTLRSRAAGLWLFALAVASVVIFKDMARIELFDAGRLLNSVARNRDADSRRRWARLTVPFYVTFDVAALVAVYLACVWALRLPMGRAIMRVDLPIRVFSVFAALVCFNAYRTVWSRAVTSNYARLALACGFGTIAGSVAVYYSPAHVYPLKAMTLAFAPLSFVALAAVRTMRGAVRDLFYALDCARLRGRRDVSRVLVYGAGLRYRSFRRELVRTTAANDRMIVGLLDDDILLRGQYIGGIKILGTLGQAPEIVNEVNADSVVVACDVTKEWMEVIRKTLAPTGVKVTHFRFVEEPVCLGGDADSENQKERKSEESQ